MASTVVDKTKAIDIPINTQVVANNKIPAIIVIAPIALDIKTILLFSIPRSFEI